MLLTMHFKCIFGLYSDTIIQLSLQQNQIFALIMKYSHTASVVAMQIYVNLILRT